VNAGILRSMRIRLRRSTFLTKGNRMTLFLHHMDGNIPFVSSVKYLGVMFDKRMTWRLHIETIETKAFRTFIRLYFLFKSERLNVNIKLALHRSLIRSVMTYACPAWEFAADTYLLKVQRLQNKVLRTISNLPRCISVRDMHVAFQIPYVYDYKQSYAEDKQKSFTTMKMKMYVILDKAIPHVEYIKGLNLAVVNYTTVQVSRILW
jgi:hypothetical protein